MLTQNVSNSITPSYEGLFKVPFHFNYLGIPPTYSREKPMQVGHMVGEGTLQSIVFLHLYGYFKNVEFGEGNLLKF